ncbi:TetR/AcrR family transcriptional regulator [Mycobacteroides saopaulense]|uniref:TetR family transcriptional regulator n=1 Tax=Mycobacteroides saopaulense TaxID=1578165 RepID=A0ABX3C252_9MYCO|nr:TetR/AcrR family transcriptional regulator [Mycobacteroides saopaulense]OHT84972.1 TetR family transcriptional regulator [Mycobacteroides saopaulense]OHU11125.1 TetR family transcriptional regulator [Mycobacteroides saopaulense]
MSDATIRRRTGGRSAAVREAVLRSALQLLAERGIGQISVGAIAEQAGVHETSIYRRWGNVDAVVLDALLASSLEHLPIPDTGRLRDDLVAFMRETADYMTSPIGKALIRSMLAVEDGTDLAANRDRFWQSRFETARVMIERAITRGELAADTNPALVLELIIAPVHFRIISVRAPLDEHAAEQIVDTVLRGLDPAH